MTICFLPVFQRKKKKNSISPFLRHWNPFRPDSVSRLSPVRWMNFPIPIRWLLKERHVINQSALESDSSIGVVLSSDESISVTTNANDHIRILVSKSGLDLESAWKDANQVDDILNESFEYAFDEKLGYMTAFPTNLGTGMRAYLILSSASSFFQSAVSRFNGRNQPLRTGHERSIWRGKRQSRQSFCSIQSENAWGIGGRYHSNPDKSGGPAWLLRSVRSALSP